MTIRLPISTFTKGFSLIELMVAIVIGLLTVLVAADVVINSARQKRESVAGTDATVNATMALYSLERDVKNAGFGISPMASSIGCEVRRQQGAATPEEFSLIPVRIVNGGGGAPDSIRVLSGNDPNSALPLYITARPSATSFQVSYGLGVDPLDVMVAVPSTPQRDGAGNWTRWCSIFLVSGVATAADGLSTVVNHANTPATAGWNATNIFPVAGGNEYWIGDYLLNLGSAVDRRYTVTNNGLQLTEWQPLQADTTPTATLYSNIVQLQAVYGRDTDENGIVDLWTNNEPASPMQWQEVIAIRVALVARSTNREMAEVTPPGNTCAQAAAGSTPPATAVCWRPDPAQPLEDINVAGIVGADWRRFRYRVVETTIPLRNAIWSQGS